MPKLKLTSATIQKLKNNEEGKKRQEYFDTLIPGLALRISCTGNKSWTLLHRKNGKLQRLTIGKYPIFDLAQARECARGFLLGAATFRPHTPPHASAEGEYTVAVVANEFIEKYAKPRNRSWEDTQRLFNNRLIPAWGNRSIRSINKPDVVKLLDSLISDGAPTLANRLLAHGRKMFNWAIERGYITQSPFQNIKPPTKEMSRDRVLSDEELKKIWEAADQLPHYAAKYIQMVILTGQRRGEVALMEWEEIKNGVWSLPALKTKNARCHDVPLASQAIEILNMLPKRGRYIFSSHGHVAIGGFSKMKTQLDKLSGVTGWTLHDLRRTCATGLARLGISPHIIEAVLNHKSGQVSGVAAVYNRHAYSEEKKLALETWGDHLRQVLN